MGQPEPAHDGGMVREADEVREVRGVAREGGRVAQYRPRRRLRERPREQPAGGEILE